MQPLARIITDSLSPSNVRLTTLIARIPRCVLAELNTHRVFSRNSASSRAIPTFKMIEKVDTDPFIPEKWGANGKGMQAHGVLSPEAEIEATRVWLELRDQMVEGAKRLADLGVHKQHVNRVLEPFLWHTVVISSTEWSNFIHLRDNGAADPGIEKTAAAIREVLEANVPRKLNYGEWHLPFVDERDAGLPLDVLIKLSVARCARVSYETHEGIRDPQKDVELFDSLLKNGHLSPFEHAARPMVVEEIEDFVPFVQTRKIAEFDEFGNLIYDNLWNESHVTKVFAGNFRGWVQSRKLIPHEGDILGVKGLS